MGACTSKAKKNKASPGGDSGTEDTAGAKVAGQISKVKQASNQSIFQIDTPNFAEMRANSLAEDLTDREKLRTIKSKTTVTRYLEKFNVTQYPEAMKDIILKLLSAVKDKFMMGDDCDTPTHSQLRLTEITRGIEVRALHLIREIPTKKENDPGVSLLFNFLEYLTELYCAGSTLGISESDDIIENLKKFGIRFNAIYNMSRPVDNDQQYFPLTQHMSLDALRSSRRSMKAKREEIKAQAGDIPDEDTISLRQQLESLNGFNEKPKVNLMTSSGRFPIHHVDTK